MAAAYTNKQIRTGVEPNAQLEATTVSTSGSNIMDGTKLTKAVLLTAAFAFGYVSAADIFVQNPVDHRADPAKQPVPKDTIRRVDEINACWDAVNNSPRFAQLQRKLWLATTADEPPTPAQLRDRDRATPADSEAAMAWLEQTRPCNDWGAKKRAGDTLMIAYTVTRRTQIQMLTKGSPYGHVNQNVFAATQWFEQQFHAQSQRPQR